MSFVGRITNYSKVEVKDLIETQNEKLEIAIEALEKLEKASPTGCKIQCIAIINQAANIARRALKRIKSGKDAELSDD